MTDSLRHDAGGLLAGRCDAIAIASPAGASFAVAISTSDKLGKTSALEAAH
jgi:hypothetical protein